MLQKSILEMFRTFFMVSIGLISCLPIHAQFYTITRVKVPEVKSVNLEENASEVSDTVVNESIQSDTIPERPTVVDKKELKKYAKARKRKRKNKETSYNDEHVNVPLTIPNLLSVIRSNNIKHEEIVLAQAILETGWFTSNVCKTKNNLFGLTNPRTKQYYEFDHWTDSVKAYYTKVQYRYKGGNYLKWLRKIGYAEAPDYIPAVISVIKQLRIGYKKT